MNNVCVRLIIDGQSSYSYSTESSIYRFSSSIQMLKLNLKCAISAGKSMGNMLSKRLSLNKQNITFVVFVFKWAFVLDIDFHYE